MATLSWSSPLELAVVIAAVSLVFRPERPGGRLSFIGVLLAVFAASDTWSFLLSGAAVAVVIAILTGIAIVCWWRASGNSGAARVAAMGLVLAAVAGLAVHKLTSGHLAGDPLIRAGFGDLWKISPYGLTHQAWPVREIFSRLWPVAGLAILASLYLTVRRSRRLPRVRCRIRVAWPTSSRLNLLCLFGVPIAGLVLASAAVSCFGMEAYHLLQFVWRVDLMVLFCATLLVSEWARRGIEYLARRYGRQSHGWELAVTATCLAALFVYHNQRIYSFITHTASREFFFTADEEELRDWLRRRDASLGKYTLATASHELNYLAAYWTHADLLLPEGFPLHSVESNAEIEERMARLLAIYGAAPASWLDFNLHRPAWDQWSWGASRLLSARHGYMYYLLHRLVGILGNSTPPFTPTAPNRTTPYIAQQRLESDRSARASEYALHRAEVAATQRIAARLQDEQRASTVEQPDVIILDEVSRALGSPDLSGYVREFRHGGLEAWVRLDMSEHPSLAGS